MFMIKTLKASKLEKGEWNKESCGVMMSELMWWHVKPRWQAKRGGGWGPGTYVSCKIHGINWNKKLAFERFPISIMAINFYITLPNWLYVCRILMVEAPPRLHVIALIVIPRVLEYYALFIFSSLNL